MMMRILVPESIPRRHKNLSARATKKADLGTGIKTSDRYAKYTALQNTKDESGQAKFLEQLKRTTLCEPDSGLLWSSR